MDKKQLAQLAGITLTEGQGFKVIEGENQTFRIRFGNTDVIELQVAYRDDIVEATRMNFLVEENEFKDALVDALFESGHL